MKLTTRRGIMETARKIIISLERILRFDLKILILEKKLILLICYYPSITSRINTNRPLRVTRSLRIYNLWQYILFHCLSIDQDMNNIIRMIHTFLKGFLNIFHRINSIYILICLNKPICY